MNEQTVHLSPTLVLRPLQRNEVTQAWDIVLQARTDMLQKGRRQWTEHYPSEHDVLADLEKGHAFLLLDMERPVGYTAISFDGEPAYDALEGSWLSLQPYAVVHRTAVSPAERGRGYARSMFVAAEELCRRRGVHSVKVDTNFDNVEMLNFLPRLGFKHCGTVYYPDTDGSRKERLAFEKIV